MDQSNPSNLALTHTVPGFLHATNVSSENAIVTTSTLCMPSMATVLPARSSDGYPLLRSEPNDNTPLPMTTTYPDSPPRHRFLAGATTVSDGNNVCHKSGSFLGVGNVECLHQNLGTAIFLLAIIIVVSLLFEHAIHRVRRAIVCPQLKKIVNRIFEEVMIMGFISMVIFTLNTSGLMEKLHFIVDGNLSGTERLHFYEFFHYIVFLSMIYFILIVLFLLFVGTVVPKLIWEIKKSNGDETRDSENSGSPHLDSEHAYEEELDDDQRWDRNSYVARRDDTGATASEERISRNEFPSVTSTLRHQQHRLTTLRGRSHSGMGLVQGSRAYALLLQRYQREGWCFQFNLKKQWALWKSFEILAYNICQHRSGYIYKNPGEMERLFGIKPIYNGDGELKPMAYDQYHLLCMRNLLFNISHLHYSAFFVLLIIAVVPVLYPMYDHWIFIGVGGFLLLVNIIIFLKVLKILRGIVDDRLRVFTSREIQHAMPRAQRRDDDDGGKDLNTNETPTMKKKKPPSLRVVALGVRAVIRMQMSALCHQQLHFHNDRFWFNSPRFLLRLFHFATIGQAFYLVWFSLVEWQTVAGTDSAYYLIPIMVLLPFIAMCVITPMTMPSLVLVMSLTGIFVELNGSDPKSGHKATHTQTKTRIRLMRRSYMRSHYTDTDDTLSPAVHPVESGGSQPISLDPVTSPTSVFLRMYDSPSAVARHGKLTESASPRRTFGERDDGPLINVPKSESDGGGGGYFNTGPSRDVKEYTRDRRSFDLSSYHSTTDTVRESHRKASLDLSHQHFSPRPAAVTTRDPYQYPQADTPKAAELPPISPAFRNYCSKYGGYPDA